MPEEFELRPTPLTESGRSDESQDSSFRVSLEPVVESTDAKKTRDSDGELPRSYEAPALYLMTRDPHTLFAYWDIDWNVTFKDQVAKDRVVFLRVLNADDVEAASLEVEPMAGSAYVTVEAADAVYTAEIGYFHPPKNWNCLATSAVVKTPPDTSANEGDADFTTVPFHLSFQRMIDLLRIANEEKASLMETLSQLRERAASSGESMSPGEYEVARAIEEIDVSRIDSEAAKRVAVDPSVREKLERILGFGASSPSGGFGGNSS